MLRLLSLAAFLATWWIAALLAGSTKLPAPPAVLATVITEAESGALFLHLGATLARVALAFVLAMTLGSAIGYLMGRHRLANRLGDPWLILLLNLPALVVIVLAYIWAGLTEAAAIAAIAINKLPTADRAGRRIARTSERRRFRDRRRLSTVRHPAAADLFAELRRRRADHRNAAGATV